MPVGENKKAAIVGYQFQAIILMAGAPADPLIPRRALPCGGGKVQKRHPLVAPKANVPKRFADLGHASQVVMLIHQFLIATFLGSLNGPDMDFP